MSPRDDSLDLDLSGIGLIEASAGTGKTFTLATLATRLLIERDWRIGQILVVTFTEAATQDLKGKMRERIALAMRVAEAWPDPPADSGDPAWAVTQEIVRAQAQREDIAAIRRRLQRAVHEIDLAAIHTIHGWCARVLADHALETGQDLLAPTALVEDKDLLEPVAIDLWRRTGADTLDAQLMRAQFATPENLAEDLRTLLDTPRLLPAVAAATPDPIAGLQAQARRLRDAYLAQGDAARVALHTALAGASLHAGIYQAESVEAAWRALAGWVGEETATSRLPAHARLLSRRRLAEKTRKGKTPPDAPLFVAVDDYLDVLDARERWLVERRIGLVHRLREAAIAEIARRKRELRARTFDDLIEGVAAALDGPRGAVLIERLRAEHVAALVDEFQDTDARQWSIFRRVFGEGPLLLVGDPKQAIYGFRGGDVHAYLEAAEMARREPPLTCNFRSRPALLRAIDALYAQAGNTAFVDPRIEFHEQQAAGKVADADFTRAGAIAPALTLRVLPASADGKPWSVDPSRDLAAKACVEAICGLLRDAQAGRARIDAKPVQAGDIAVLVRKNSEAAMIRAGLVAAGIPAVTAGKRGVYASDAAQDVLMLLEALLRPGDEPRWRAALASVLLGVDAEGIARLDTDAAWQRRWQATAQGLHERWLRHGPLAMLAEVCAQNAQRVLARRDGERRLTDTMHLGELLQEAAASMPGPRGQLDWLRERMAATEDEDDATRLRLESDARCVRILTLHKSKGLEFPLVFLPFAAIGGRDKTPSHLCESRDAQGRYLRIRGMRGEDDEWKQAVEAARIEARAEDARLLYVGLTRARHGLWLACGPLYETGSTPLAAMLADLPRLRGVAGVAIDERDVPEVALPPLPATAAAAPPPARVARRALRADWWVYSFSSLTRDGGHEQAGAEHGAVDETAVAAADSRFGGVRFGNALHVALEGIDFARWRDVSIEALPPEDAAILATAMRQQGYAAGEIVEGLPLLSRLVHATLHARLPEGLRLCDLPDAQRRAEMEFHFLLAPVEVERLIALFHAHGLLRERGGFGMRQRIEGLMTGRIDLVYAHAGRFCVLDYKSNRLPAYDADRLAEAMRESEYDLQALIYALAVHRWLRFRLGAAYDYDTHFGGVRYLFCRGLDANGAGIHAWRPERELIDALDALLGAGVRSAA